MKPAPQTFWLAQAAFKANGTTLNQWAKENNYTPYYVKAALSGTSLTKKAKAIYREAINACNLEEFAASNNA